MPVGTDECSKCNQGLSQTSQVCNAGQYHNGSACVPSDCPPGSTNSTTDAFNATQGCKPCPAGTQSEGKDAVACTACAAGTWAAGPDPNKPNDPGFSQCNPSECNQGQGNSTKNATSATEGCEACATGLISDGSKCIEPDDKQEDDIESGSNNLFLWGLLTGILIVSLIAILGYCLYVFFKKRSINNELKEDEDQKDISLNFDVK